MISMSLSGHLLKLFFWHEILIQVMHPSTFLSVASFLA